MKDDLLIFGSIVLAAASATPGACTRIIFKFEGYPGRYVWHCHILEHEDNEMMRPYEVIVPAA